MNDNNPTEPPPEAIDEEALRRRLVNRIVLAGVAIVALLGGLAVIDMLYVAPSAPVSATLSKNTETAFIPEVAKPVAGEVLPSRSAVPGQPLADLAPTVEAASPVPPEPPAPEAIPSIKIRSEPEESSPPVVAGTAPQPKQVEPTIPDFARNEKTVLPPAQQFVMQMGVFNNVANAQELLAKLQKGGVPAQIVARVQVGPFKTKAEAAAMHAKLKAMGLEPGILMATHK